MHPPMTRPRFPTSLAVERALNTLLKGAYPPPTPCSGTA